MKIAIRIIILVAAALVLVLALAVPAFAQSFLIAEPAPARPAWYADPALLGWVLGTIAAVAAVFARKDASTKEKALSAIIVGVERATQLPQVKAAEKQVKQEIQRFAVANGVEPQLAALVQRVTKALPPPQAGER